MQYFLLAGVVVAAITLIVGLIFVKSSPRHQAPSEIDLELGVHLVTSDSQSAWTVPQEVKAETPITSKTPAAKATEAPATTQDEVKAEQHVEITSKTPAAKATEAPATTQDEVKAEQHVEITSKTPAAKVLSIECRIQSPKCRLQSSKGFCDIQPMWTDVSEYLEIPELEQLSFCKKHDWFRKFTAIELRRGQRAIEEKFLLARALLEKHRSKLSLPT